MYRQARTTLRNGGKIEMFAQFMALHVALNGISETMCGGAGVHEYA